MMQQKQVGRLRVHHFQIALLCLAGMLFVLILPQCMSSGGDKEYQSSDAQRIVSLAPSITKQLKMLGASRQIVGHTSYCPFAGLDSSILVASAVEVNVERILALKPSLVLCSSLTNRKTVRTLKSIGVPVQYMPVPESYKDICNQFEQIGKLVGKQDKAEAIVALQNRRIDSLRATIPDTIQPKIFIEIGAKPLFAATSKSFMHDFIRFSNGKNIAAGLKKGSVNRERVLSQNPDFIFIVTMGIVGQEERKAWLKYPNLTAAKKQQVYVVDPDKTCSPTPVSFTEVLEIFINIIYKENE